MPMFFKPVTVGPDGRQHIVAPDGSLLAVSYIPVSTEGTNILKTDANGLVVQAKDMVSATQGNLLSVGLDGKLVVEPQELPDYVSKQDGNYVRYGNDKGVYVDGNDVLSNASTNILTINPVDGKIQLTEDALKEIGLDAEVTVVSKDVNNLLTIGTDKGALLQSQDVATAMAGTGLTIEPATGRLTIDASMLVDGITVVNAQGKLSVRPDGFIDDKTLTATDGKVAVNPQAFVDNKTITIENGVMVTHAATDVASGDKLLYKTLNGAIGSEMSVLYDRATGLLRLLGVNGASLGEVTILGAESVLEDVDFVIDPLGQSPGAYLLFTFRLQNGQAKELFVNMSYLSDVYRQGMGISIGSDLTVSARLAAGGGLGFNVAGEIQLDGANVGSVILGEMISKDADNTIVLGTDNKLYSAGGLQEKDIPKLLSAQGDNALTTGLDGRLYVPRTVASDFLSATPDNTLTIGLDGKLYNAPVKPTDLVSAQEKNLLTTGLDGKLYAKSVDPVDLVSLQEKNLLIVAADGKLYAKSTEPTDLVSGQAGNKLTLGSDGKLYASGITPEELINTLLSVVSTDSGNAIQLGSDGKLYVPLDHGTM